MLNETQTYVDELKHQLEQSQIENSNLKAEVQVEKQKSINFANIKEQNVKLMNELSESRSERDTLC